MAATTSTQVSEVTTRMTHPDILHTVVSFVDDKHALFRLLQVSKAFYHAAAPLLYHQLVLFRCDFTCIEYSNPLSDRGYKPALLRHTQVLQVYGHKESDCAALAATLGDGALRLPKLKQLSLLRPTRTRLPLCRGLDCPVTRRLRPTLVSLDCMSGYHVNLDTALLSNVSSISIDMGYRGLHALEEALNPFLTPSAPHLHNLRHLEFRLVITAAALLYFEGHRISFARACDNLGRVLRANPAVEISLTIEPHGRPDLQFSTSVQEFWELGELLFIWNNAKGVREEERARLDIGYSARCSKVLLAA